MHLAELEVYGFYLRWLLRQKLSCLSRRYLSDSTATDGSVMLEVSLLFEPHSVE